MAKRTTAQGDSALGRRQWTAGTLKSLVLGRMPAPRVVSGAGAVAQIGAVAAENGCGKLLVVSDRVLEGLGLVDRVVAGLARAGVGHAVFAKVEPNVPAHLVEEGLGVYKAEACDGIVVIGGGSPMDCAKLIGARVCRPNKTLAEFAVPGFGVADRNAEQRARYPVLIAVPTTAGTGSETSVAAVFLQDGLKKIVTDAVLVPKVAVLDPEVTLSLPPHVTAATGMDALTHAIESYVSTWADAHSRAFSLRAVDRIGRHLLTCFHHGDDARAREQMLLGSFEAGVAFTNVSVGYVHAIAHTLGAFFGVPHGAANAAVLPHVLDFYLSAGCADKLADLAVALGAVPRYTERSSTAAERADAARSLVATVRAMNAEMGVAGTVKGMMAADVECVADRALLEAHGGGGAFELRDVGYPVPAYMSREQCVRLVSALVPGAGGSVRQREAAGAVPLSRL